jgi:PAS domain S-box-containing protein
MKPATMPDLHASDQIAELRARLSEAEETLHAIRSGEVDAITVSTPAGEQIYSLKSAEQPYREMIEAMSEGAVNITADGMVLYCNQCFARLTRVDPHSIMGSSLLMYFVDRDRATITRALQESRDGTSRVRAHLQTVDGTLVPVNVAMHVLSDGGIHSIVIVTSDLTQMVVAQEATNRINLSLEQANRALRVLNVCNTIIIHATDEMQVLADTCRALVASGGYKLAWIGYAEPDQEKPVRPVAWADGTPNYGESAGVSWGDGERDHGPTGTAIRTGRMTVVRDTDTDVRFGPRREMAHREGCHSSGSIPLRDGNDVFGALMVYSGRPDAFDEQESLVLTELADDIAYCVTNLRREAKLAETRALLDNILQSSRKYAIIGEDRDRKILFWSEGARHNYGYTADEVIGQIEDILHTPEDRASGALDQLIETVNDKGIVEVDVQRVRKDGTRFPAQIVVTRRDDAADNRIGYLVISSDVSEKRHAEAALQESTEVFRTLTEAMPQMVWTCTPDGLNTYFNQQWVDYTGLTLEESHGRGWDKPFHPDDKQAAQDAWSHATETGEAYHSESRLRAADGSYRWFLMRGLPVRDASGLIVKWFGTSTDIDELKRAEEQLRAASQYARSLLEASLDPLVTISPDGKITDVNHGTELITGQWREYLIGTDVATYFTEPEKARAGYRRVFTKGFLIDYPLAIRHVAGTVTAVLCNASLYYDASGTVGGMFLAARDISRMPPSELTPAPRRQGQIWRYAGYAVAAMVFLVAAMVVPAVLRDWLQQQQEQSSMFRSTAAQSRIQSLLLQVSPIPARVRAAKVQLQPGTDLGLSYITMNAIGAPNHDPGLIGKEELLSRFSNEMPMLATGNCVHLAQQLTYQTPTVSDSIVCPIAGKSHRLIGLLFMSWDQGDPVPVSFDAAIAATKQAAMDIAAIWTGDQ